MPTVRHHHRKKSVFGVAAVTAAAAVGLPALAIAPAYASLPTTQNVTFEVSGAQGSGGGGGGGVVTATKTLAIGSTATLTVGGSGGFNGGGAPGGGYGTAYSGGGASDVRVGGTDLASRVLVAGGGGGLSGAYYSTQHQGGGAGGGNGSGSGGGSYYYFFPGGGGGGGATQSAGGGGGSGGPQCGGSPGGSAGSLGLGGAAGSGAGPSAGGGGGGGGYYGGGGGGGGGGNCTFPGGGGGGGSGYIDPSFTTVGSSAGTHGGDGLIRISLDGGSTWVSYAYTGSAVTYTVPNPPDPTSTTPARVASDGGTHFTINGDHLSNVDAVTVGGHSAAFSVNGDGSLDVVTPAGIANASNTVSVHSTADGPGAQTVAITGFESPSIASITPSYVDEAGGATVTITGSELLGSTVTVDGTPVTATVTDSTITFVAPAHGAGTATVTVDNGDASATGTYSYDVAPTISDVSPAQGPLAGGNTITITGDHFIGTPTVMLGAHTLTPVTVTPTTITALAPSVSAAETDSLTVTTTLGTATLNQAYSYVPGPAGTPSPTQGPAAGHNFVTITGTNLWLAEATVDGAPTIVELNPDNSISVYMPEHAAGTVPVVVTTDFGSMTFDYTYYAAPTISSSSPADGPVTGAPVTLSGTGFDAPNLSVTVAGTPVTPTVTPTSLSFTMPAGTPGPVTIAVSTIGGTASTSYTYVAAPILPASIDVSLAGGSLTLTGQHLTGAAVTVDGTPVTVASDSDTAVSITVPAHAAGEVPIVVTTAGGTATMALRYAAPPVVTAATSSLVTSAFPAVTITGTDLLDPTSASIDGRQVSILQSGADAITVMAPLLTLGRYTVTVTTAGGTATMPGLYAVTEPTAVLLSTSSLKPGGRVTVNLRGFNPGAAISLTSHSKPASLGTVKAGLNGRATIVVTIPAGTPTGSHVIEASGADVSGAVVTVNAPLTLVAAVAPAPAPAGSATPAPETSAATLPFTGFNVSGTVAFDVLLFAGGLTLVLVSRRRRSR